MPKTRGRAARHQSTRVDFTDIVRLLAATFGNLGSGDYLWPQSPATLRKCFNLLLQALGFDTTRSSNRAPYDLGSLRGGGATFLLQQTENADLVRRKGRWLSSKVMEIYLQEASVSTYTSKMSQKNRDLIEALAGRFPEILDKAIYFMDNSISPLIWPRLW